MIASITVTRMLIQKLEEQIRNFLRHVPITTSMVVYDQSPAFKLVNETNGAVALVKFEEGKDQCVGVSALLVDKQTYNQPVNADRVKVWEIDLLCSPQMRLNRACVFIVLYLGTGKIVRDEAVDKALIADSVAGDTRIGYKSSKELIPLTAEGRQNVMLFSMPIPVQYRGQDATSGPLRPDVSVDLWEVSKFPEDPEKYIPGTLQRDIALESIWVIRDGLRQEIKANKISTVCKEITGNFNVPSLGEHMTLNAVSFEYDDKRFTVTLLVNYSLCLIIAEAEVLGSSDPEFIGYSVKARVLKP